MTALIRQSIVMVSLLGWACPLSAGQQLTALAEGGTARDGSALVLVSGGEFVMGTGEGLEDQGPPHVRNVPSFYIDRTEVSCAQYARFIADTGAPPPPTWGGATPPDGWADRPVTTVTWFEAMKYALWAGKRLPTEAEWEKAARGTDGRRFPWGHADDERRRNVGDDAKLLPVSAMPAGVSPYGCVHMSGNAWEWTAEWYRPYPGATMQSAHFGRKYKVVRGGGAIYFYGINNPGHTTHRARILPCGAHDGLGFRCVQDLPGAQPPYDPAKLLRDAEDALQASLRQPLTISYETQFQQYLKAGRFPLRVEGRQGREGPARIGIPWPEGLLEDVNRIHVMGADGHPLPTQVTALSRWGDDSLRWALVDFNACAGAEYSLSFNGSKAAAPRQPLQVTRTEDGASVETGSLTLALTKAALLEGFRRAGSELAGPISIRVRLGGDTPTLLQPLPAEQLDVEEAGPVRGVVRLRGGFAPEGGPPHPLRYDLRLHATAGSSRIHLLLTLTHHVKRDAPPAIVSDVAVSFAGPQGHVVFGTDRGGVQSVDPGEPFELLQPDDLNFTARRGDDSIAKGTRSPGWLAVQGRSGWVSVGLRHFWQNHPKALFCSPESVGVRLWAGVRPFEWEGGLAKTHEIVLDFSEAQPSSMDLEPLRVIQPAAWACGTQALGPIVPRCQESLEALPYWELLREWDMRKWVRAMPTGMRDFGDAYFGGPYKGKNAFTNLEYDVGWNFLLQFLRTEDPWYATHADMQLRHQADIDIDHFSKRQWKHSPLHTTTEADLGHVFLRGLVLHYWLTGERRSLEAAIEIGDWLAPRVKKLEGIGNERQIGWSLYALTGVYEATRDEKYIEAARTAALKLHEIQEPSGKFKIRWDNRISFFNGIAMNGLLEVFRNCGDERIAETILRLGVRTLGQYPEYALRTMNAFCWAAERTQDPRFISSVQRTWETSMEFLIPREATTAETHAWYFPRFAVKQGTFALLDSKHDPVPDVATWRTLRLEKDEHGLPSGTPNEPNPVHKVELYARVSAGPAAPVLAVTEGLIRGRVEVVDMSGELLATHPLRDAGQPVRAAAFSLPGETRVRLRLLADGPVTWQIHHDGRCDLVLHDRFGKFLPSTYPRAYGFVREGAKEITIKLEAIGEGFHSAVLYDSDGNPAGTVRHFIDFEDPGRYQLELKAPVSGEVAGWSLEIYNARVLSIDGLLPYWSTHAEQLFNPERVR
jgi:formylglycine-generating enzyme required for sulfatase activity